MKDYNKQAKEFLVSTGVDIKMVFKKNDYHFKEDTDKRDIYSVTISRGSRSFTFDFGQSIAKSCKIRDTKLSHDYTMDGKGINCNKKIVDMAKFRAGFPTGYMIEVKGNEPTAYDILTCLTKYDPNTFEDFCDNFGYNTDSISAVDTYKAVKKEWKNVQTIWTDKEIELLIEIQ